MTADIEAVDGVQVESWPACMLDLETLSTVPGGIVFSIGAVMFDPKKNELGPRFNQIINVNDAETYGLHKSLSTMAWWDRQSTDARAELEKAYSIDGSLPMKLVLDNFDLFFKVKGTSTCTLWGNGADFDAPMLRACYDVANIPVPWDKRDSRCHRTLKELIKLQHIAPEIPHHALHDAIAQAKQALAIFNFAAVRGCELTL